MTAEEIRNQLLKEIDQGWGRFVDRFQSLPEEQRRAYLNKQGYARLGDLLAALGKYRSGHLGVAEQVADLRVTGSFPLTNTDLALESLVPALPVKIERHTQWWVNVVPK